MDEEGGGQVRLAALVETLDHVCCRYRLRAFQPRLLRLGHKLDLQSLPRSWWSRLAIGAKFADADGVVLQRKLLSRIETGLLRRRARRLIFDFDDAIWLRDSFALKGLHDRRRTSRFRHLLRHCDAIIAGNSFLAAEAVRWAPHADIHVIPTCVDVDFYPEAGQHRTPGQATFVWIGSSSTLRGLEAIQPLLECLGKRYPGIELKLICDRFLSLSNLRIVSRPWSEETELADIASSHIGLSWVPDDDWSQGKCGLKVLQYMAAGLPVIANPVGVHTEMVRHGETGFLARNEHEWIEFTGALVNDPELCQAMGAAGRAFVKRHYSIAAGADRWARVIDGFAGKRVAA